MPEINDSDLPTTVANTTVGSLVIPMDRVMLGGCNRPLCNQPGGVAHIHCANCSTPGATDDQGLPPIGWVVQVIHTRFAGDGTHNWCPIGLCSMPCVGVIFSAWFAAHVLPGLLQAADGEGQDPQEPVK